MIDLKVLILELKSFFFVCYNVINSKAIENDLILQENGAITALTSQTFNTAFYTRNLGYLYGVMLVAYTRFLFSAT